MSIKLSPKYGVNPSIELCPVCGASGAIMLPGRLPGDVEAPMYHKASEPCEACQKDFEGYKKIGFLFIVVEDIFEKLRETPKKISPWPYFLWLSVVKKEAAHDILTGIDMSQGACYITETLAKGIGIERPKDCK